MKFLKIIAEVSSEVSLNLYWYYCVICIRRQYWQSRFGEVRTYISSLATTAASNYIVLLYISYRDNDKVNQLYPRSMWTWVELIPEAIQMHPLICCLQAHAFLMVCL
jgi:hypothetical protein